MILEIKFLVIFKLDFCAIKIPTNFFRWKMQKLFASFELSSYFQLTFPITFSFWYYQLNMFSSMLFLSIKILLISLVCPYLYIVYARVKKLYTNITIVLLVTNICLNTRLYCKSIFTTIIILNSTQHNFMNR